MIDRIDHALTYQAWPWIALGLVMLAIALGLAHHYETRRLPRARRSLSEHQAQRACRPAPARVDVESRRARCG